ncbi:exonuclease [Caudoviricetes sp.]|nr:exonuclease [Caudoviricetes sp.]UOF81496.1 exonuclease [Caudoviricetes sp.]
MAIELFDFPQNSEEWYLARSGIATMSDADVYTMKGKGGGESETRKKLLYRKAGEIITGKPAESYSNHHMERGHALEPEARNLYAFMTDCDPTLIGFVRNGRRGASPDALIGNNGVLEIKTKMPERLIPVIEDEGFPSEHKAQTQGILMVAEREWIDLACYWPGFELVIRRAYRDEEYIAKLSEAIDKFNDDLDALVERIRKHGQFRKAA